MGHHFRGYFVACLEVRFFIAFWCFLLYLGGVFSPLLYFSYLGKGRGKQGLGKEEREIHYLLLLPFEGGVPRR